MGAYEDGFRAGFLAAFEAGPNVSPPFDTRLPPKQSMMKQLRPKRKGKKDPKMARALRKANQIGRTKAGKLRKGYTQAKIMKKAHQLRRKMR